MREFIAKYGLSINQIADAVRANNSNAGGAMLDNRQQSMVIRGVGLIQTTADIEFVVVSESKGVPVFVKDVGKVEIGSAPPTGIFGANATSGGVEGIVLMRRGENPTEVLKSIKAAVEDLNTNRLPKGVTISAIYDRTDLVNNTLTTVSHTLLEGLGIVVLVLIIFLGSFRAARRAWPKLDALETMTELEWTTYDQWLRQPDAVLRTLESGFQVERKFIGWGKLMWLGRRSD